MILKCHHRQMALAFFVCVSSFGWQQLLLFRDDCKILSAAVVPFSLFKLPEGQKRGWYESSQMGWPAPHRVRKDTLNCWKSIAGIIGQSSVWVAPTDIGGRNR